MFCEQVWNRLEEHPPPTNEILKCLVAILQDDDNVLLARLVIPDLRIGSQDPTHPVKRDLFHQINPHRSSLDITPSRFETRDAEAHALYEEEKTLLQEAELYRAAVLLYGHGNTNEGQKERLRRWLATYPAEEA